MSCHYIVSFENQDLQEKYPWEFAEDLFASELNSGELTIHTASGQNLFFKFPKHDEMPEEIYDKLVQNKGHLVSGPFGGKANKSIKTKEFSGRWRLVAGFVEAGFIDNDALHANIRDEFAADIERLEVKLSNAYASSRLFLHFSDKALASSYKQRLKRLGADEVFGPHSNTHDLTTEGSTDHWSARHLHLAC